VGECRRLGPLRNERNRCSAGNGSSRVLGHASAVEIALTENATIVPIIVGSLTTTLLLRAFLKRIIRTQTEALAQAVR